MKWLDALRRRGPPLDATRRAALSAYRALPRPGPTLAASVDRLVVVDVETSGLDPYSDRLISIGAVAVSKRLVRFDESFEVVLKQSRPSDYDNVMVHGIGGSAQLTGRDPTAALLDYLAFVGASPLVAFHAPFDRTAIERSMLSTLGMKQDNSWLDLAVLLPALMSSRSAATHTLNDWAALFQIDNYARHNALADALAAAQLLLVALALARQQSLESVAGLVRLEKGQRWLQR